MVSSVPAVRVRALNSLAIRGEGEFVLYWMTAFRRLRSNFALQRAVELARELRRPLVILEALRCDYPWASDRLHRFVIDGMAEHAAGLSGRRVTYLPYVEPEKGAGKGLLLALAAHANVVVTDDFPCFFLPRMAAAAARQIGARLEAVDSNGILPLRAPSSTFSTAYSFRAYLQKTVRGHLADFPATLSCAGLPDGRAFHRTITARWPMTPRADLERPEALIRALPIDHSVAPAPVRGGERAAAHRLRRFVNGSLDRYCDDHGQPDADGTSRLSPYLHFGHISAHDIFAAVMTKERWTSRRLAVRSRGARTGWWGVAPGPEAFLDQLITWREIGFNFCATRPDDYASFSALPAWARATLGRHVTDRRAVLYSSAQLERAGTHDEVWNAAQRQLTRDGWMHNYLRMLWGKRILEWTRTPEDALAVMTSLMNKHALDGRDPNSYSGYGWTLGRYDRAWGPERPIFGTVRYMSSANTKRKLRLKGFLQRYG